MLSSRSYRGSADHWGTVIDEIDNAVARLYTTLDNAFSEGQTLKREPRVRLKRNFFRDIWKKLQRDPVEFASIAGLDAYYKDIHDTLEDEVETYLALNQNRATIQAFKISDPISANKRGVLRKVINLYHAFMRNRYLLLKKMKAIPDASTCALGVEGLTIQADNTNELVRDIDASIHYRQFVDPLILMNQSIITKLRDMGYGEINVADIITEPFDEYSSDKRYEELYKGLEKLPAVKDINLILGSKPESRAEKEAMHRSLKAVIEDMEVVRVALKEIVDDLASGHEVTIKGLKEHYDSLNLMIQKINARKSYQDTFQAIRTLRKAQLHEKEEHDEVAEPRLMNAAIDAMQICRVQSSSEKFTFGLVSRGWKAAADEIASVTRQVIQASNAVTAKYQDSYVAYKGAIKTINSDVDALNHARRMLEKWHEVIDQTKVVMDAADQMIHLMQTRVNNINETTGGFVLGFLKRHWGKMTIGGVGLSGAGAALAFTVMSGGAAAAVLIPTGFLLGNAGGASVGLIKDHVKPPNVVAADVKHTEEIQEQSRSVFNQAAIFEAVFGEGFLRQNKHVLDEFDYEDEHSVPPLRQQHEEVIEDVEKLEVDWSSHSDERGVQVDYDLLDAELFPSSEVGVSTDGKKPVTLFRL